MPNEPKDPWLIELDAMIRVLSKLSVVDLGCRVGAIGHAWHYVQPDWVPNTKGVTAMAKQCQACDTIVRFDVSDRYGEILGKPRYEYSDEYLVRFGGKRIKPQGVRAVWAKHLRAAVLPEMVPLVHTGRSKK